MRVLLPHLRLLSLRPDDAVNVLHSFLTPDELLHVLHFQICGTLKNNIPDTLNINAVGRMNSKLTEYCVTLIPDAAVSEDFEHLKEADVYFWYRSHFSEQKNMVTLTPKNDIYLTGFECLGSFRATRNCNLKFNKITDGFEIQPSIRLTPVDFFNTRVKISPSYYNIPSEMESVQTKFGYHKILESAQFIPKGQQVTLEFTLISDKDSYRRRFRLIKDTAVNEFIQTNKSCKDFGKIVVKQCDIADERSTYNFPKPCGKSPFFIKNIRFIKSC
jgi:hypothetical protein